jgi:hypothetical protein
VSRRSLCTGVLAGLGLALFYVVVVWAASGSFDHLVEQAIQDWYFLAAIIGGFGVQVGLVSELRHRHRLQRAAATTGVAGMGASTGGMIACCAHHIADLAPFIGATGAAGFLIDYRIPFMAVGVGVNAIGVVLAVRRLQDTPSSNPHRREASWAHA